MMTDDYAKGCSKVNYDIALLMSLCFPHPQSSFVRMSEAIVFHRNVFVLLAWLFNQYNSYNTELYNSPT